MADDSPSRGELWLVRLPRAVGAELQRDRPAIVISSPAIDALHVRIVVPLTTWRDEYEGRINKLRIEPDNWNGLHTRSAADILQVRSVSTQRFLRRIGVLEADEVEEIVAGVAIAVDYIG
ncbi:MAG: type II toxin-antitoxin system PemK/MazF family toxin [Chloroflexota bacterium]|nr:type II toxin-antitoxin system PemK/MazF family toxin [Chloroflexota bacterium]